MNILYSSIHAIDIQNNNVEWKESQNDFNDALSRIIATIEVEEHTKKFVSRNDKTVVVKNILDLIKNTYSDVDKKEEYFKLMSGNIANKLLNVEIVVQDKNDKTNKVQLQKGSIIQALIIKDESQEVDYFIAKIEHTEFIDADDFIRKIGFQSDKAKVWKSCKFKINILDNDTLEIDYADIFLNNVASYWTNDFLELDEMTNNIINTKNSFASIDAILVKTLKQNYRSDFHILRNSFITQLATRKRLINYHTMINDVFDGYESITADDKTIKKLKNDLINLPKVCKLKFETQFETEPSAIKARKFNKFRINEGIELVINKNGEKINDISKTISSIEESGKRYIKIETNDDETFSAFIRK